MKISPAGIYLFKVNNRNIRTMCEICSKLTIKITVDFEQVSCRCLGDISPNFKYFSIFCPNLLRNTSLSYTRIQNSKLLDDPSSDIHVHNFCLKDDTDTKLRTYTIRKNTNFTILISF